MSQTISALGEMLLFSAIYLIAIGALASSFHMPFFARKTVEQPMPDLYEEAAKTDFQAVPDTVYIKSPADVFRYVSPLIAASSVEHLILLLVNHDNCVVGHITCTDEVTDYVRLPKIERIAAYCKQHSVSTIIVAHNHPQGTIYPSAEDVLFTNGLISKLRDKGITLTDHLIVTPTNYRSIRECSFGSPLLAAN